MKWTLVTGGAKRLGAEIVRTLAKKHYPIVIHYCTSKKEAYELAEECRKFGGRCELIEGNFSTTESVQSFIQEYLARFPETENLINNVGNYTTMAPLETPLQIWQELYQVNFFTPIALIQAFAPSIKKTKGSIINIGVSGLESHRSSNYGTAYNATKNSLLALTKAFAKELAHFQVRVNMVSPGYLDISVDCPPSQNLPMKRSAQCEEVARTIEFLIDPKNGYITGQNIEISGGVRL